MHIEDLNLVEPTFEYLYKLHGEEVGPTSCAFESKNSNPIMTR